MGIHKEPYHATLIPYANLQEALLANRRASSYAVNLNGLWKFNWMPRPEKKDFPHVMSEPDKKYTAYTERNPVGSYRREFEVPANWNGRRIFITFDGVDCAFFIWVNDKKVGYSINRLNAAEFDLTKYVKAGKNMVAVEVYAYSSGTWLEDQDMWRLHGILRDVTLWSSPYVHIRNFL